MRPARPTTFVGSGSSSGGSGSKGKVKGYGLGSLRHGHHHRALGVVDAAQPATTHTHGSEASVIGRADTGSLTADEGLQRDLHQIEHNRLDDGGITRKQRYVFEYEGA